MEWTTTSTILASLRDFDNQDAWQRFVDRFRKPVIGFARRLGFDGADAEDIAQETLAAFAGAFRDGRYDRERGRLSHWLFGIAYRHILRERQRQARAGAHVSVPSEGSAFWSAMADERAATDTWDAEWERSLWKACAERARCEFESTTFRAFELVVVDDRPPAVAARELGLTVKAVYNAKHRVLKRIRAIRAELEDASPPA